MSDLNLVKQLREQSGAGMMACKKALEETNGDLQQAFDLLRKQGILKAGSKSDRATKEGYCCVVSNNKSVVVVKLNCETDFVAKNDKFIALLEKVANFALQENIDKLDILADKTKDLIAEQIAIIGENITIGELKVYQIGANQGLSYYVHNKADNKENVGKIVSLIIADNISNEAEQLLKQINMHITAMSPVALKEEDVSKEVIDRETEVYKEQVAQLNKPEEIAKKMIDGKLRKFFEENILLNQVFVIDNKTKIRDVIANFNKENSQSLAISSFCRTSV